MSSCVASEDICRMRGTSVGGRALSERIGTRRDARIDEEGKGGRHGQRGAKKGEGSTAPEQSHETQSQEEWVQPAWGLCTFGVGRRARQAARRTRTEVEERAIKARTAPSADSSADQLDSTCGDSDRPADARGGPAPSSAPRRRRHVPARGRLRSRRGRIGASPGP